MLEEVHEGLLEAREIVAVGFHVIGIDVGHHRDHRIEQQEGGVRLVRLGDQEVALAEPCIGASRVELATNHEGRVHAALGEDAGDQRGGGGLAVGAGNGDSLLEPHQLGEHLRTRHDWHMTRPGGGHFRVVVLHRGRGHHRIRTLDIRSVVPLDDRRPSALSRRVATLSPRSEPLTLKPRFSAPRRCRSCRRRRCPRSECV